jgi:hypothetical protein
MGTLSLLIIVGKLRNSLGLLRCAIQEVIERVTSSTMSDAGWKNGSIAPSSLQPTKIRKQRPLPSQGVI